MAQSSSGPNNALIKFRGKPEREMPMKSKAMNAAMHAAAEGKSTIGIPKKVGKKFVAESHGQKVKSLPKYARKKAKGMHRRGLISDKAMKRMEGGY